MEKQLIKFDSAELQGIEKSKATQIKATFEPMSKMLIAFEDIYNEVILEADKEITIETIRKAKRLRLDIGKVRIETEKIRKDQKDEYLRAGKAIDGVSNILKWAVTDKENKLKDIENHFEILERKRLEALQLERAEKLSPYVEDAFDRKLSEMEDDVWIAYFEAKKKAEEDRIEAEKKAEEDRIEAEKKELEERKRIKEENIKLKKEAEKREKDAKIEEEKRQKAEKIRLAKEEVERKKHEEREKIEREKHEAELKRESREREKLQAELKAKEEAETKAKKEEYEREQAELKKGDSEKVKDLISDLESIKSKYIFRYKSNKLMYLDVNNLLDKIINHIK